MEPKNIVTSQESLDSLSKKGTCIEFFSAYQDMDLDRMLSLCAPESTIRFVPLGDQFSGKIWEVGKNLWGELMDAFPNLDNTVWHQNYDESKATVTCVVDIFGTQAKHFAGITCKKKNFESEHIFIFRFDKEGKISDLEINWNHEAFVRQLS